MNQNQSSGAPASKKKFKVEVLRRVVVTTTAPNFEAACKAIEGSNIAFDNATEIMSLVSESPVDENAEIETCQKLSCGINLVAAKMAKDLAGISAMGAMGVLRGNWAAAIGDRNLTKAAMSGDLLEVIELLQAYRSALINTVDDPEKAITELERELDCFELPSFDSLSPDETEPWLMQVRESSSEMGPKEALRLARQAYYEADGLLPATLGVAA